ncbi:GNAT family N-acetyltransferase [Streptomyces sp. CS227]|uniref:GNAT family N-acetyltransferase n=1 Tax=Streptomyces sp. CS227 TaxID=1982763 RepID=UPI000B4112AF|nr:GNAT family N-acetyltransferase [Streptomyces sp. CS227]OWA19595.1 GNAT family N-acetyltransferase [Streptomyces sp. CS227]
MSTVRILVTGTSGPTPPNPVVIALTSVSYDSPVAREVTRALHAEQVGLYSRADGPEATQPAEFTSPQDAFFVVTGPGGTAMACGGWRTAAQATAEIKRMYVTPAARGRGLDRQILVALEGDARRHRMTQVILETGVANTAALALYASGTFDFATKIRQAVVSQRRYRIEG